MEIHTILFEPNQTTPFIPYDNSHIRTIEDKSYLFEYNPILALTPTFDDNKYYGIFSPKFGIKTGFNKPILEFMLDYHRYKEYDLIAICHPLPLPYLRFTDNHHMGFMDIFTQLCDKLNIQVQEPSTVIYANQFIAKGWLYKKYVSEVITPAIEILENDLKELAWKNSGYNGLKPEKLKELTGLKYYTFHTFLLERLLSVWLENQNYKTLELLK
jgi:hypothetical protein